MLKRTELRRKTTDTLAVPMGKCKACRQPFVKFGMGQKYCRAEVCAEAAVLAIKAKREKAEASEHRKKLGDSKPLAHWLALTERVVNHYVLTRDAALTCISCGTGKTVQWEAGHYLSVGSHPELRFDPKNINKQCHRCNCELSGNQAMYAIGFDAKWGKAERERLEGPHAAAKFTREELAAIRKQFAAKARELKGKE
jgi:hypothetical protein